MVLSSSPPLVRCLLPLQSKVRRDDALSTVTGETYRLSISAALRLVSRSANAFTDQWVLVTVKVVKF